MQILIYGGIKHGVRCEIGNWNLANHGWLEDTYSVSRSWSIGFGRFKENFFLFLKRIQDYEERQYPYTILLVPGEEVWQKFSWNAAHLAYYLLSPQNPHQNLLLKNPEAIGPQQLSEMLNQPPLIHLQPQLTNLSQLIFGTLFENDLFAVNLSQLGASFPNISELANQIEALPPFARFGNGWLFGGGIENVKGFGINLVFDNNLSKFDDEKFQKTINTGAKAFQNWESLDLKSKDKLNSFANLPSSIWQERFGRDPKEILDDINRLAGLKQKKSISDNELFTIENQDSFLAQEINQIKIQLTLNKNQPLSTEATALILENFANGKLGVDQIPAQYLDKYKVSEWLVTNQIFPSKSPIKISFNEYGTYEICAKILEFNTNIEATPELFSQAIYEIKSDNNSYKNNLGEIAFKKTLSDWINIWVKHRQQDYFSFIHPFSLEEAKKDVKSRNNNWKKAYLYYTNDLGGEWLKENVPFEQSKRLVESILDYANDSLVLQWLEKLKYSSLRRSFSVDFKKKIATQNNQTAEIWANFLQLRNLVENDNFQPNKLSDEEERNFLEAELEEFLPNFSEYSERLENRIKIFFGNIPNNVVHRFKKPEPVIEVAEPVKVPITKEFSLDLPAFDEAKVVDGIKSSHDLNKMIISALMNQGQRQLLIENFAFDEHSIIYRVFPHLPLKLRAIILRQIFEQKRQMLVKEIVRLSKGDEFGKFSLSVWETLPYLTNRDEVFKAIEGNGGYRGMEKWVLNFIRDSIQQAEKEIISVKAKQENKPDSAGFKKKISDFFSNLFSSKKDSEIQKFEPEIQKAEPEILNIKATPTDATEPSGFRKIFSEFSNRIFSFKKERQDSPPKEPLSKDK